jgi:hypothetical protein
MTSWLDEFSKKNDSLADHFRPPVWFRPFAEIASIPGLTAVAAGLWSTPDGYYVHARDSLLQQDGTERRFIRPVVIVAFLAASLDAVQWHRHVTKRRPDLAPLKIQHVGIPRLSYAEWTSRFEFSESASYRVGDGSGAFVDKVVRIGPLSVCFLSRTDDSDEMPYLFEICHAKEQSA